jgi:hypothetical protein
MATTEHPTATPPGRHRDGLDQPQPNLVLHAGSGPATRRSCGSVLAEGWRQHRVEATAAPTSCPVFIEVAA